MTEIKKTYDLEQRTFEFAAEVIRLCKKLRQDTINIKLIGQLINSSGSVGANYREANEALSKKDFIHRMKIARKECKESSYWLDLVGEANSQQEGIDRLKQESCELRNIFTAIINKVNGQSP